MRHAIVAISFPRIKLPRVDDLLPFTRQKALRERAARRLCGRTAGRRRPPRLRFGAVAAGLPAVPIVRGNESKETRAWTIAARYETGQVYHLDGAPWVDALETELRSFPNRDNDDQVDVLSDAGAVVAEAMSKSTPRGIRVG